jgi:hypothetical protein
MKLRIFKDIHNKITLKEYNGFADAHIIKKVVEIVRVELRRVPGSRSMAKTKLDAIDLFVYYNEKTQ